MIRSIAKYKEPACPIDDNPLFTFGMCVYLGLKKLLCRAGLSVPFFSARNQLVETGIRLCKLNKRGYDHHART
jgi:hypothetical protein